jgi:hypothetical protein
MWSDQTIVCYVHCTVSNLVDLWRRKGESAFEQHMCSTCTTVHVVLSSTYINLSVLRALTRICQHNMKNSNTGKTQNFNFSEMKPCRKNGKRI